MSYHVLEDCPLGGVVVAVAVARGSACDPDSVLTFPSQAVGHPAMGHVTY